jgi:hypothetical protein
MSGLKAIATAAFTASFVASPFVTAPFSGFREDQLPFPQIDPPVQPAGWAFSIWGLIYAWLVVSAVFGLWQRRDSSGWDAARPYLTGCLAIGTFWLAIANASAIWATVTIFIMAILAIAAATKAPGQDRWLFQAPVGILAGWLTAASFVSLGSTAAGYGLIADSTGWAWIAIICALAVGVLVQVNTPAAPEYGITIIWALSGIIAANLPDQPYVAALAGAGIAIMVMVIVVLRRAPAPA